MLSEQLQPKHVKLHADYNREPKFYMKIFCAFSHSKSNALKLKPLLLIQSCSVKITVLADLYTKFDILSNLAFLALIAFYINIKISKNDK